jgi:hypothetical protein
MTIGNLPAIHGCGIKIDADAAREDEAGLFFDDGENPPVKAEILAVNELLALKAVAQSSAKGSSGLLKGLREIRCEFKLTAHSALAYRRVLRWRIALKTKSKRPIQDRRPLPPHQAHTQKPRKTGTGSDGTPSIVDCRPAGPVLFSGGILFSTGTSMERRGLLPLLFAWSIMRP